MAQQQQKAQSSTSAIPPRSDSSPKEEPSTWGQRNGGKVIGAITFGLLGLATFLMWLANNH